MTTRAGRIPGNGGPLSQTQEILPIMSDKQIRAALVGVGGWGSNILRALLAIDTVRLTHICDANPDRVRALIDRCATPEVLRHPNLLRYAADARNGSVL